MIKAIIFDFFGVFRTDAYEAWLQLHGLKREGGYYDIAHLLDVGAITNEEFFVRLSALYGRTVTYNDFAVLAVFNPEVRSIAYAVHKQYKTSLLSNSSSNHLRKMLEEYDLLRAFDDIVISGEVGLAKPDPAIFHLALDRLTVQASEVIFIDDNPRNVAAATALGIASIRFESAEQLKGELTARHIVFETK